MTSHRLLLGVIVSSFALQGLTIAFEVGAQGPRRNSPVQKATLDWAISDLDEPWGFQQIFALELDHRERVFAWDSEDYRIRIFNADGKPERLLGRKGQGPGELSQTGRLSIHGDTLWVTEIFSNRLTAFALNEKGVQTVQVPTKSNVRTHILGKVRNGLWAASSANVPFETGSSHLFIRPNGTIVDTLLRFLPDPKLFRYDVLQANVRNGPVVARQTSYQPFLAVPLMEVSPDGSKLILIRASVGGMKREEQIDITAIDLRGDTIWTRSHRYDPTPITNADYEAMINRLVAPTVVKGLRMIGNRRMIADSMVRPPNFPAFTKLVLGVDGSIWLEHGSPSSEFVVFWRYSPTGAYEATAIVPFGFRLMAATKSRLYGTRKREDGLPVIERYSLKN